MNEYDLVSKLKQFATELYDDAREIGHADGVACVFRKVADNIHTMAEDLNRPIVMQADTL